MSVAERLIRRAQAEGVSMHACGRRLHLRAASPPIPELIEAIRVHKEEILEALQNDRRSLSIGCLKPPEPMRTCPGCHGGLQPDDEDLALCRTCRWSAESLAPTRVQ